MNGNESLEFEALKNLFIKTISLVLSPFKGVEGESQS